MLFCVCGCGETAENTSAPGEKKAVDVDLSVLSGTVVYAEVFNMTSEPTPYLGKTVRMRGNFSVYTNEMTGQTYFACIIPDATACCSQGIEFILADNRKYPEEYPTIGEEITVSGVFGTYLEDGYVYCRLTDAKME